MFILILAPIEKVDMKKKENPLTASTAKTIQDKLLEEKPDLIFVKKEFKIKVLKKLQVILKKPLKA